jgi:hypothetical protein
MTEEAPENWTASKADDVEMRVAYAALPTLAEVQDHMVALASRFGVEAAYNVNAYLRDQAETGAVGVRVFTRHRTMPVFSPPANEVRDQTEWANVADMVQPGAMQTIGGLIWPLPGGNWQYVYLRADGGTMRETVSTAEVAPEPAEEPLSAARYTDDADLLHLSKEFVRVGVGMAAHLRDTADKIERHARNIRPDLSDLKLDHNYAASEILHDINTMHGNLNTSGLLRSAAEADRHARNPDA